MSRTENPTGGSAEVDADVAAVGANPSPAGWKRCLASEHSDNNQWLPIIVAMDGIPIPPLDGPHPRNHS